MSVGVKCEAARFLSAGARPSGDEPNVNRFACPSRGVLEHVTSRWGVHVPAVPTEGSFRFSELWRVVGGVSEKMPAQTLQTLERDGFVNRGAKPVTPAHVDYSLTRLGRQAADQVWALARWAEASAGDVMEARAVYDRAKQA